MTRPTNTLRKLFFASLLALIYPAAWANADLDELISELDQVRQRNGVAGAALVLVTAGRVIWSGGLGVTDWQQPQPVSADSYVRIGSISKGFTGLALLKASLENELRLDRPIRQLIDPVPLTNRWKQSHPVTIAQLLEHSAGLTDMVKAEWDHNTPLSLAEALEVAPHSRQLQWPAGLHSSYSNSGAGIAAHVFEQQTKRNFEHYVEQAVFKPLGMSSATFELSPAVSADLITGYDRDGKTQIPYWHTLYRPFGGINVRVRDMAPFVQMLINGGQFDGQRYLSTEQIRRFENPATTLAASQGLEFGYGLGSYHYLHRGLLFHGHGGDADGYLSHYGYNRDSGLGYFLVINAFQGSTLRAMRRHIEDFIVTGHSTRVVPGQPQPKGSLEKLAGTYRAVSYRFPGAPSKRTVSVEFADGMLSLRQQRRQRLIPLGNDLFRREHEPVATTAFIHRDGQLFLQGPMGNFVRQP